jgi:hypothetical protein
VPFATSLVAMASCKHGRRFAIELECPTPVMYNCPHEGAREYNLSGYFRHPRAKERGTRASFAFIFRRENRPGGSIARASCSAEAGARATYCREIVATNAQLVGANRKSERICSSNRGRRQSIRKSTSAAACRGGFQSRPGASTSVCEIVIGSIRVAPQAGAFVLADLPPSHGCEIAARPCICLDRPDHVMSRQGTKIEQYILPAEISRA